MKRSLSMLLLGVLLSPAGTPAFARATETQGMTLQQIATTRAVMVEKSMKALRMDDEIGTTMSVILVMRIRLN